MASSPITPPRKRSEKRRFTRRQVWMRCWVLDEVVRRYACIADLGAGGARIITALPPLPGTTVNVLLQAERHSTSLWMPGLVIWSSVGFGGRGGVMGVEFRDTAVGGEIVKYFEKG